VAQQQYQVPVPGSSSYQVPIAIMPYLCWVHRVPSTGYRFLPRTYTGWTVRYLLFAIAPNCWLLVRLKQSYIYTIMLIIPGRYPPTVTRINSTRPYRYSLGPCQVLQDSYKTVLDVSYEYLKE